MSWSRPIRVLVVGELGTARGEPFTLRFGELNARLEDAAVRASVEVEDRLGDDAERRFELRFPKLRSFTVDTVVRTTPLLAELLALTEHVSARQILPGVERLVGRGRLYRALVQVDEAESELEPPAKPGHEQTLDDLLRAAASAGADRQKAAARALDVFVRAGRDKAEAARPAAKKPARGVHEALERVVRLTAGDLLAHPRVATFESGWRGLKLLADHLPENGSVALEVADVRAGYELDVLQMREHDSRLPRPDVVLLHEPSAPLEMLRACAEQARRLEAVCVVGLDNHVLGVERLSALRSDDDGVPSQRLRALRSAESARWLCLAANPMLLHSEPMPSNAARLVFGSATWAIGALLLAAQRGRDRFTRMLGPDTLLRAPTFWVPSRGADAGMALPTLEFCSLRAQADLARLGVTALGSTRRGDEALISCAPTAYGGEATQSLASQLVIGRIVRAAREARELVAEHEGDEAQLARAAQLVAGGVPSGLERVVRLDVSFESRRIAIDAATDRFEALSPFQIAFALDC